MEGSLSVVKRLVEIDLSIQRKQFLHFKLLNSCTSPPKLANRDRNDLMKTYIKRFKCTNNTLAGHFNAHYSSRAVVFVASVVISQNAVLWRQQRLTALIPQFKTVGRRRHRDTREREGRNAIISLWAIKHRAKYFSVLVDCSSLQKWAKC